jgi:hypothetical protein
MGTKQPKPRRNRIPKTIPHSFGFKPGVDLDKLNQLADELEAEAFAAKQRSPRRLRKAQSSRPRI